MQLERTEVITAAGSESDSSETGWLSQWRDRLRSQPDEMFLDIRLFDRLVRVRLTPQAVAAATALSAPLIAEMELYFSCMIRKAVRFRPGAPDATLPPGSHAPILQHLGLQFRPVTTEHCHLEAGAGAPPLETMPVTRPAAFVPRWLTIDFHRGDWLGEFGY